jgi:lysophospholipase L1-like esterase
VIVFFGDSITRDWPVGEVAGARAVNAGIAGETTGQMRLRFERDVLGRRPAALHLLGGINDIGENQGPVPVEEIAANLEAMVDLALAAGIPVVLGLLLPCTIVAKRPAIEPRPKVRQLNEWMRSLQKKGLACADYFGPLQGPDDCLRADCTEDGLHPNARGYAAMTPVARAALARLGFPGG